MKPLIELNKIEMIYENDGVKTPALRGIALAIKEREFVAVMGPSGSGKSTLLHILGLLERPTRGTYHFRGRSVAGLTDNELAKIRNQELGFVFQAFNLLPRTSVIDNVKLPLIYANVAEREQTKRAEAAVEAVGLTHRLNHESGQLSGGEKQRVAMARALVTNPSVIFADEPTGNLDSKSGGQVMNIIKKLNLDGRTVVLITHEKYTAEYAERVITLKDGSLESDHKVIKRRTKDAEFMK